MKREACTKVSFHYTCILIPITKILNLLLLSHAQVCKISCINSVSMPIKSIINLFASCSYSRKSRCKKKFLGGDHTKTERLGWYFMKTRVNNYSGKKTFFMICIANYLSGFYVYRPFRIGRHFVFAMVIHPSVRPSVCHKFVCAL